MNLVNNFNFKIFFKYIYFNIPHLYLTQNVHNIKNISIILPKNILYFSTIHMRFSTIFYSNQLVDIFSYELPNIRVDSIINTDKSNHSLYTTNSIIVYNFHNLTSQERFFIFCVETSSKFYNFNLNSIADLFSNANWLEREVSELSGVVFINKKDLRNLMLQYGDSSTPFRKSTPSIGVKEVFYDSINDTIVSLPLVVQV